MYTVRITLSHATDLAASDYNGKSDPYVTFEVDGRLARSSCRPATCDPHWIPQEHFDFKITDPISAQLIVKVYDHDLISKDDLLGTAMIALKDFVATDSAKKLETSAFSLVVPQEFHRHQQKSQLFLSVRVVPLDIIDIVQEMWENETWVVGKGWCSGEGTLVHHRARWSSEDGVVSSHEFEKAAPKMPNGYESPGWTYSIGRGDPEGWYYATTFAGPWYDKKHALAMVRRRKWVNICRRTKHDGSPRHSQSVS